MGDGSTAENGWMLKCEFGLKALCCGCREV